MTSNAQPDRDKIRSITDEIAKLQLLNKITITSDGQVKSQRSQDRHIFKCTDKQEKQDNNDELSGMHAGNRKFQG